MNGFAGKPSPRGFTLPELLLGLAISAVVLTALAVAASAVAQVWENDDGSQQLAVQGNQVITRIRHYLTSAKYIGVVQAGSLDGSAPTGGGVFYWAYDGWNSTQDWGPQVGELAFIEHNAATKKITLYAPIAASLMTASQKTAAGTAVTKAELADTTWPALFKSLSYVTGTVIGQDVSGATFALDGMNSTSQRPLVEVMITLTRSPQPSVTEYTSILLRAPSTRPSP